MYHTIESIAASLNVSVLVVQRRAVKLGIWTPQGVSEDDIHLLSFLKKEPKPQKETHEEVEAIPATVEKVDVTLFWYGEFKDGKPLYRPATEAPVSKGTVAATPSWSSVEYTPVFKEKNVTAEAT